MPLFCCLQCLAYFHLRFLLKTVTVDTTREALPLKESPPAADARADAASLTGAATTLTAEEDVESGPTAVATKSTCSALVLYRAGVMVMLLLLFAALHPPSPAGLNPAVAYTAAWLSRTDEYFSPHPPPADAASTGAAAAASPLWNGAGSWLSFFLLFSFAPYLGSQIAAILWCR